MQDEQPFWQNQPELVPSILGGDGCWCCKLLQPNHTPTCATNFYHSCYRHHGQCKYVKDCEYTEPLCTPSSVPTWFLYRAGGVPGWLIEHGLQLSEKWDQKLLPGLAGSTRTAFGLPLEKSKLILYLFHFWNCSSLLKWFLNTHNIFSLFKSNESIQCQTCQHENSRFCSLVLALKLSSLG